MNKGGISPARAALRPVVAAGALAVLLWSGLDVRTQESAGAEKDVGAFLERYCIRCHGPQKQKGDFRIDTLSRSFADGDLKRWLEIVERINAGQMPPEDVSPRPTVDEGHRVVAWISARIKDGEAARLARRDRVSFHRLTREEYVNAVYDLLGVRFDAADPGGLDEDPGWHGFERIGAVLSLSPSHVEKYFAAAETILAEAYPDEPVKPFKVRRKGLEIRNEASRRQQEELKSRGLLDKVRVDIWPGHRIEHGGSGPHPHRFKSAGVYRVSIQVSGLKPQGGRAPHVTFYAKSVDRMLFEADVVAPEERPVVLQFEAHLPAGDHDFCLTNDVPGPSTLPRFGRTGRKPFLSVADGRIPWQLKLTDEEGKPLYPFLILDWIEWEGPIVADAERERRERYVPTRRGDLAEAREKLSAFAERAFRRPLREAEIDPYVGLVEREIAAGADGFAAVKSAMLAILCSKDFLYVVEGDPAEARHRLNDWELASRLSFFLWSTMPDDQLFRVAREGRLSDRPVLEAQVERMLRDPRAERFATEFPRQWLQLQKVGMFTPDAKLYPEYDKHLERSMVGETTAFFREVLRKSLTLREFLDSDWTMLNARLAEHYGVEGVREDDFRPVPLRSEHRRGGVLTHASVLSLTSDGQRHRPVHRGVWISESIFGKSPPPPPANVDPIEPNPTDAPKATIRMKLEAHTRDPRCAACHRNIDPFGLAFDHYDAVGGWRERERVANGTGEEPKVDAGGTLPGGRAFVDARAFRRLMLEDLDAFNAAFVEKLATFALRRAMTVDDREDLATIAAASKSSDYRLGDLVKALVVSDLFQKR